MRPRPSWRAGHWPIPTSPRRWSRPAQKLAVEIEGCSVQSLQLLPHLIGLAGGIPQPRQLAEVALGKVVRRDLAQSVAAPLAEAIRQMIAELQTRVPDILEQLTLHHRALA